MTKAEKRNKYLLKKYGIGIMDYNVMFNNQKQVCALCLKPSKSNLHVEHNHKTGKVRALVCFFCNKRRIGQLNYEWARRVYEYMVKYDG
jgi:hypothetical protein